MTALNRLVDIHAAAEIAVERLDLRMPGLSRRLNRIITNCGRAVFKAKLADLNERFGIATAEINPAYTSQECEPCGFEDRRNRKSQSEFRCLHCGHTAHADVNGAKVVAKRPSLALGLDLRFTPRGQVLGVLRKRFAERHPPGTQASSGRPAGEIPPRGNESATSSCSSPPVGRNACRPAAPESEIRSAAGSARGASPPRRNDFYDAQQAYHPEREDLILPQFLRLVDVSGVSTLPSTNSSRCRA
jgi:putative transposase